MTDSTSPWPAIHQGWPGLTSTDPMVDQILRDLFAEAHGPATNVTLSVEDPDAVLDGTGLLSWSIDGEDQERVHLAEVLFRAIGLLNRWALDVDPARFHVHAALVGDGDHTLLIPGVRGAGKTTLAAALIDRGWAYGTDEMVAIDHHGTATPLRKPLNLKPGSLERFEHIRRLRHPALTHWPTDRAQLGVPPRWLPHGPFRVTDIVIPQRSNRFQFPKLVALTHASAVRLLAENSFDFERHGPIRSLEVVAKLVGGARPWTLLHNDALDAASVLHDRLAAPPEDTAWHLAPPDVVTIPALDPPASGPHTHQGPGTHGLALDGHGVIWSPAQGRVVEVTPPAFAAWATADGTMPLADRAAMLSTSPAELARIDDRLLETGVIKPGAA